MSESLQPSMSPDCTLDFDASIYSQDALLRTAYNLGDVCDATVRSTGNGAFSVDIYLRFPGAEIDAICSRFRREATDQMLREKIRQETSEIRQLIFAQAFADVDLLDRTRQEANYLDDPLGIATPHASSPH